MPQYRVPAALPQYHASAEQDGLAALPHNRLAAALPQHSIDFCSRAAAFDWFLPLCRSIRCLLTYYRSRCTFLADAAGQLDLTGVTLSDADCADAFLLGGRRGLLQLYSERSQQGECRQRTLMNVSQLVMSSPVCHLGQSLRIYNLPLPSWPLKLPPPPQNLTILKWKRRYLYILPVHTAPRQVSTAH